jgi:hypothetical protein
MGHREQKQTTIYTEGWCNNEHYMMHKQEANNSAIAE